MKLSNIFKKADKTTAKANVEKLEKKQLDKVIGGASADTTIDNGGDTGSVDTRYRPGNNTTINK